MTDHRVVEYSRLCKILAINLWALSDVTPRPSIHPHNVWPMIVQCQTIRARLRVLTESCK